MLLHAHTCWYWLRAKLNLRVSRMSEKMVSNNQQESDIIETEKNMKMSRGRMQNHWEYSTQHTAHSTQHTAQIEIPAQNISSIKLTSFSSPWRKASQTNRVTPHKMIRQKIEKQWRSRLKRDMHWWIFIVTNKITNNQQPTTNNNQHQSTTTKNIISNIHTFILGTSFTKSHPRRKRMTFNNATVQP